MIKDYCISKVIYFLCIFVIYIVMWTVFFFFSSRRRHTRLQGDWSSDVCSSDLGRFRKRESLFTDARRVLKQVWLFKNAAHRDSADHPSELQRGSRDGALTRGHEIGRASCRERV